MQEDKEGDRESYDTLGIVEKTMAILADTWWPRTASQGGDKICERFLCNV